MYIAEAHPDDGWAVFGTGFKVNQHQNEVDRITAAKHFVWKLDVKCNVAIDLMSNDAAISYGSMVNRAYILHNGIVHFEGGPGPEYYNLKEIEEQLKGLCGF